MRETWEFDTGEYFLANHQSTLVKKTEIKSFSFYRFFFSFSQLQQDSTTTQTTLNAYAPEFQPAVPQNQNVNSDPAGDPQNDEFYE